MTVAVAPTRPVETLIVQAKELLGVEYHLVDCFAYIAILHPQFGAAALVPDDNKLDAETGASELNEAFKKAGILTKAIPLALSATSVEPPILIRSGPQMATDIAVTMGRASVSLQELSSDQYTAAKVALEKHAIERRKRVLDPTLMKMIQGAIAKVTEGKRIFAGGPEVSVEEVVMPEFLLPAVLLAAAENWTMPVAAQQGKGGFVVHMKADDSAVLMFRVSHIEVSSPLLLMLPLVDVIRRSKRGGEYILDECITRFGNFITGHLTPELETSLELRIATSS
ncbi:hypothetical protein [Rhizobium sp. MHM7A]|uniref:hypothetical protein n=1 Tax=Rhizobium sp. MHM7A TaxID=2583233 RepID=UPI001106237A|nr:hypothetical protein [Rhizobium sp. MHM7A]TLX16904.1 hypothetical protein FFR93_06040 [Rhizobium sp. MHM7A]